MRTRKSKMTARRHQLHGFLVGAVGVALLWVGTLYGHLDENVADPQVADHKTSLVATPDVADMTARRASFTHDQVHVHSTEQQAEEITNKLTAIGIAADPGTLELIDTMGERYNRMSIQVASDLADIAAGNYDAAMIYGVSLERRLVGTPAQGQGSKPLAIKNLRYEVIQTWKGNPSSRTWKIGKKIFGVGGALPSQRNLPDNPRIVAQSFLDVMPTVMQAD